MKVLVVGLGSMGKRRIRNLLALGVQEIHAYDPRADRVAEAETQYKITATDDFSLIDLSLYDRMIVSTPPDRHMHYAHLAADYKIPCFIEASVVDTDMKRLIERCEQNPDLIFCPSCTFHFHPAMQQIAKLLGENAIGNVSNFTYHFGQYLPDWHPWEDIQDFYVSKRETGGGREIVPFELTWMNMLFGAVQSVNGFCSKTISLGADIDDTYAFSLRYACGILGNVVVDVVSRIATRLFILNGDQGQIRWDWDSGKVDLYRASTGAWESYALSAGHAQEGYNKNLIEEMYIEEIRTFLRAADGNVFPNTLQKDYEILQLLYAIEQSSEMGRNK